jgi:hypothetical protein
MRGASVRCYWTMVLIERSTFGRAAPLSSDYRDAVLAKEPAACSITRTAAFGCEMNTT